MNSSEIVLRPARPTREEGAHFARFMNMAADGGFQKMFGRRFEEIVSAAYLEPNHDLSYETVIFAEIDGLIVGMASGFTAEQYRGFDKKVVDRLAGRSRFRISLIYALIAPMMRFLHMYDDGDFYLEFLAVDDAHRGKGIGAMLLNAMEERGRENGSTRYAIDVSGRNPDALRLYETYGFSKVASWPKTKFTRPMILRLVKLLNPAHSASN